MLLAVLHRKQIGGARGASANHGPVSAAVLIETDLAVADEPGPTGTRGVRTVRTVGVACCFLGAQQSLLLCAVLDTTAGAAGEHIVLATFTRVRASARVVAATAHASPTARPWVEARAIVDVLAEMTVSAVTLGTRATAVVDSVRTVVAFHAGVARPFGARVHLARSRLSEYTCSEVTIIPQKMGAKNKTRQGTGHSPTASDQA